MNRSGVLLLSALTALFTSSPPLFSRADENERPAHVDATAWGGDHVGKKFPEYVTGDECLFCHRAIGPAWERNRHQLTIRPADPDDPALVKLRAAKGGKDLAGETQYLLGADRATRFLKRAPEYGRLEMLTAALLKEGDESKLTGADPPRWDGMVFGDRCAGCHTTAVDAKTRAYSALSLDCFSCHGDVPLAHSKDTSRVLLSKKNHPPRAVVSLCGQCHLRGGKSKSTGLPYPNTFVAGDNLFRDFRVDLSDEVIASRPAIERHIYENARDVALSGETAASCVTCHDVHTQSTEKHRSLARAAICASCHAPGEDFANLKEGIGRSRRPSAHSRICEY